MSEPVVRVENLGKRYRLNHQRTERYMSLRDELARGVRRLLRADRNEPAQTKEDFWALREVTFTVNRGETLGIIGRNGAGKSTLLKILSRITEPTTGEIEIDGRVASLLEVGTGFHPELTGRENIYLNGAILGMSRREIRQKFDEIVAFAEVERFLDTPVKRYSSGMYVRLAFAVAAHMEPEILVIDEVLAVGDVAFQAKCLGKIQTVAREEGRTVLFVSHNLGAIKTLCSRAILLDGGRVEQDGDVTKVVDAYLQRDAVRATTGEVPGNLPRNFGTGEAFVRSVRMLNSDGEIHATLYFGQPFRVCVAFEVARSIPHASISLMISTLDGTIVAYAYSTQEGAAPYSLPPGEYYAIVDVDTTLMPGSYALGASIEHTGTGTTVDYVPRVFDISVQNVSADRRDHYPWNIVHGFVRPKSVWRLAPPPRPVDSLAGGHRPE
jgi:lipopolysaccharide transport system ATP-binding protein